MMSNVELKELEEQSIARDNRVSCNQIRTKQESFGWLKKRWKKFRIAMLNKKLEGMKDDLVTSSFNAGSNGKLTQSSERRLARKTTAIAKIEEKIKILSKKNVPASYVRHRAIKLRNKMMDNLVYNCSNAYSVGIENYDKIFGEDQPIETPVVNLAETPVLAAAKPAIDVAQVSADQQAFASEVNKAMNPEAATPISRETIEDAVNQSFEKVLTPPTPTFNYFATPAAQPAVTPIVTAPPVRPVAEVTPEVPAVTAEAPINRETIEKVVDQSFDYFAAPPKKVEEAPKPTFDYFATPEKKEEPVAKAETPINRETIEKVVDQSFDYFAAPPKKVEEAPKPTFDYFAAPEKPVEKKVEEPPKPTFDYFATPEKKEEPVAKEETPINRETIEKVVDQSFDYFAAPPKKAEEPPKPTFDYFAAPEKKDEPVAKEETPINRETIEKVVDQSFDYFATPKKTDEKKVEEPPKPTFDYFAAPEKKEEPPKPTFDYFAAPPVKDISPEEVKEVVSDDKGEPVIDYFSSDFIEEMKRRKEKYNYVPMTDEEIAKARDNIEYDKYEKIYKEKRLNVKKDEPSVEDKTIREQVVITPEREEKKEEKVQEKPTEEVVEERTFLPKKEELHFDYSNATEKDVKHASSYESSRTGLESLKERLLKIKEEHKQSELELKAARDEQTDEARKAMEVREVSRAKKQDYEDSVKKLQDLCDSLEEETKVNMSSAAISRNDTECNRRFIQMHTAEIHEYEDKIREIDSIISQESDDIKRR